MIYKKSVVLSSVAGGNEKAVVSLEYDGGEILGNVRLYNFEKEPCGILSLGILNGKDVLKAGLTHENEWIYSFKLNSSASLNAFSCALINFDKGEAKPLLLGATSGAQSNEENLCNSMSIFEEEPSVKKVKEVLDKNQIFLEDQEEVDELAEQAVCGYQDESKCSQCKYRDAFFKLEGDSNLVQESEDVSFFDGIREQIDELFEKYPKEDILSQIIPDSKWVKIENEGKGEYYVVGLLYSDNKIKYVCYGVPSMFSNEPPKEFSEYCQWLPIDTEKEGGFGYWIAYQDADTGENVKMEFETVWIYTHNKSLSTLIYNKFQLYLSVTC